MRWWGLRTPRKEKKTCYLQASACSHSLQGAPRKPRMEKTRDTGPRERRCVEKGWFQWAQTLASSRTKRSAKFLNLGYLVFFNQQSSCDVQTTCTLWPNLYITWLLPSPLQSSSPRVTSDAVSWAWSPKNSHWIKHNSQLLGCGYFLSQQLIQNV